MAIQNQMPENQAPTERDKAPVQTQPVQSVPATPQWVMPRQKRVERQGDISAPYSHRFPQVRGGVCEFCGVLDSNTPSQFQYKLCPHYRGMQLRCTYCKEGADIDDVNYHSTLNVAEHPNDPSTLVVWCDSYECSKKHLERFKVGA